MYNVPDGTTTLLVPVCNTTVDAAVVATVAELVLDELEVLKLIVYPLHVVQFAPSFFIVNVTLLTALVAVNVAAAPAFNVVEVDAVADIVVLVLLLVHLLNEYPVEGVATIACVAALVPAAITVPAAAKAVPLNVIVVLVKAPVIV